MKLTMVNDMAENGAVAVSVENEKKILRNRKAKIGTVVSDKMAKSIVVKIERREQHPIYKKYLKKTIKILAHDEKNEARIGDKVSVVEVRPLSRLKSWSLSSIIEKVK